MEMTFNWAMKFKTGSRCFGVSRGGRSSEATEKTEGEWPASQFFIGHISIMSLPSSRSVKKNR